MQFLIFTLTYPLIWLLSMLPMRILYMLSDVIYVFVYYIFRYRREVVLKNLKIAFPDKSNLERNKISKYFFKHFTDSFVETIKSITISEKEILKRYKYKNPEIVNDVLHRKNSIAFVSSHQANWEWFANLPLILNKKINGTYKSLGNRYFDKIVKSSRERFGFVCYESSKTVKPIYKDYINKIQGMYLLISDQSPQLEHTQYWGDFFNTKVPFHIGAETLAKRFNLSVVFCATKKIKRGYYETNFTVITEEPDTMTDYEITNKYIQLTEKLINEQPEYYLWSHNRFKHKDKFKQWKKLKDSKIKRKKKTNNL